MGNCMSSGTKTLTSEKETHQTTKRTTQTIQRNDNNATIKKPTPVKVSKPSYQQSKGHKLSDNSSSEPDSSIQILSPKEAAAKAAEQRMIEKAKSQGKLGNKLEQERKKSARTHLADESERVIQMKKASELVYD